ncbi:hypothetical protein ACVW2L_001544 [Mucilaginibacter sp. HD30]
MLYHLIYISKATALMPDEGLDALLKQSRFYNLEHDITDY